MIKIPMRTAKTMKTYFLRDFLIVFVSRKGNKGFNLRYSSCVFASLTNLKRNCRKRGFRSRRVFLSRNFGRRWVETIVERYRRLTENVENDKNVFLDDQISAFLFFFAVRTKILHLLLTRRKTKRRSIRWAFDKIKKSDGEFSFLFFHRSMRRRFCLFEKQRSQRSISLWFSRVENFPTTSHDDRLSRCEAKEKNGRNRFWQIERVHPPVGSKLNKKIDRLWFLSSSVWDDGRFGGKQNKSWPFVFCRFCSMIDFIFNRNNWQREKSKAFVYASDRPDENLVSANSPDSSRFHRRRAEKSNFSKTKKQKKNELFLSRSFFFFFWRNFVVRECRDRFSLVRHWIERISTDKRRRPTIDSIEN